MNAARAVIALAVVGLCRVAFFHFISEPLHEPRRAPIDPRYQRVRELLPASGEIGYVSDLAPAVKATDDWASPGTKLYLDAQYALSPLLLRFGDIREPVVIANVSEPDRLAEVLEENGLRLLADAGSGLAVARPR